MQAGRMSYRVTVLRRGVVAGNPGGDPRGDFAPAFTMRAQLTQTSGYKRAEAGLLQDQNGAVLRVYSTERTRSITIADRLIIEGPGVHSGMQWSVEGVNLPDFRGHFIEMNVLQRMGG